ncbi:hypothetical protein [Streptomyces sp. NPDC004546]|uniref:hypothetical protein n=1 Tax=unclassified Streptomyces TaxID=2593676 RepID=UPI0033A059E3
MSHSTTLGSWDGPWYRVHTEQFEAASLPSAGEDLESVDNVDVVLAGLIQNGEFTQILQRFDD